MGYCKNCAHATVLHQYPTKPNGQCVVRSCDCKALEGGAE